MRVRFVNRVLTALGTLTAQRVGNGMAASWLAALIALGVFQTLQTRRAAAVEAVQMRGVAGGTAERFSEEIDRVLSGPVSAIVSESLVDVVAEAPAQLAQWEARTGGASLVSGLYLIDPETGGVERVGSPGPASPAATAWRDAVSAEGVPALAADGAVGPSLFAQYPAVALPIIEASEARPGRFSAEVRHLLLVTFDRETLRGTVLPEITDNLLGSSPDYDVLVSAVEGPNSLYATGEWPEGGPPDATALSGPYAPPVPLITGRLPRGRATMMTPPGVDADAPRLRVGLRHRAGSIERYTAGRRRIGYAVIGTSFVLLLLSGLALFVLTRRAQSLAAAHLLFAAGVSHELRTPLAAISLLAENLRDGVATDPGRVRDSGGRIYVQAVRLRALVERVLTHASFQGERVAQMAPVDVRAVVEAAVRQQARLGVPVERVEVAVPRGLTVLGNEATLTIAIENLISNAHRHGAGLIVVTSSEGSGEIRLRVSDEGEGVDPADVSRLFDPFYRGVNAANVGGSGLGLSLVRQIAEDHGGSTRVVRDDVRGFTVEVRLPVCPERIDPNQM